MGRRGPRHAAFRQGGGAGGGGSGGGGHAAAPVQQQTTPAVITLQHPHVQGPHPGFVKVAAQYILEHQVRQMLRDNGCDPSREVSYRLQGVQLIDNVREALQLPVKTFATACTYYHKFRLNFRNAEYCFQDAALAALLVACKVEDTIKKSRDILCASYNLKNLDKPLAPDDKFFEDPSRVIVGLDRIILQTVSFDFRARHPHKILIKLIRKLIPADDARQFLAVSYPMIIDLYKTFAPLKQTSFTMALAVIELTARMLNMHIDKVVVGQPPLDERHSHTTRACVIETIMDLLDLYTEFNKSTKIGPRFDLNKFIDIKIKINKEVEESPSTLLNFEQPCAKCQVSKAIASMAGSRVGSASTVATPAESPSAARHAAAAASNGAAGPGSNAAAGANPGAGPGPGPSSGSGSGKKAHEGTMRYILESEKVRAEEAEVAEYYKEEYDEVEVEVDELIPEPLPRGGGQRHNSHNSHKQNHNSHGGGSNGSRGHRPAQRERNSHNHRGGGGSNSNGGNGNGNTESGGWAPYPRSRNDRHKNRKGGGGGGNGGGNGGGGGGGGGGGSGGYY